MTELKREQSPTEFNEFQTKFKNKGLSYFIKHSLSTGKILCVESDNQEILNYVSKLGLK